MNQRIIALASPITAGRETVQKWALLENFLSGQSVYVCVGGEILSQVDTDWNEIHTVTTG